MNDFYEEINGEVGVVAVYMMNVEEIFYEVNSAVEWNKYQFFLVECLDILKGTGGLLDIVMHNGSVYGIFNILVGLHVIQNVAAKIIGLSVEGNELSGGGDKCRMIYGVGIAVGTGVKIRCNDSEQGWNEGMWFGNVLRRAEAMAQLAISDGKGRIFTEKT